MKNILFTLVFISILGSYRADATEQIELTVIATGGLNLRENPTLDGKVLATIPYLEKVAVLDEAVSQTDTVGIVNYGDSESNFYQDHVVGEWVKVKHQNYEGYVFNAYLMQEYLDEPSQGKEDQYAISFDGVNCVENIHRNKNLKWKGVFKDRDQFEIRDIRLEYYMSQHDEYGAWCGTVTKANKSPLFMIGAVGDQFKNGPVEGTYYENGWIFDYSSDSSTVENLTLHVLENEAILTITEGRQQQKLNASYGIHIVWKGDLDGDGKNDYIFTLGEESSNTTLYLSTEASEDQLISPVATYYSGDCC